MSNARDELADVLAVQLNKKFKDGGKIAYFLDGSGFVPTNIKNWISTGSSLLDLAISNKPHGGLAVGRICEINGLESTGKSLLGAHILAETQKRGGIAVYIDTETSVSDEFLTALGVDVSKMLYLYPDTVEDIFEAIEHIVGVVRESDKDKMVTILVDSLAGAPTQVELEADFTQAGWATQKAIITSKAMRKITQMIGKQQVTLVFTNQLRVNLGAMFGDKYCVDPYSTKIKIKYKLNA